MSRTHICHLPRLLSCIAVFSLGILSSVEAKINIATLGDSLTDEYKFYPIRNTSENWVQFLAQSRSDQVSFGDYTEYEDRSETRNLGYGQNWARSGARGQGVDVDGAGTLFTNQYFGSDKAPGLLTQEGGIQDMDVVTLFIGSNDYGAAVKTFTEQPYPYTTYSLPKLLEAANDGILDALFKAIAEIRGEKPSTKIVVITPPDLNMTPRLTKMIQGAHQAIQASKKLPPETKPMLEYAVDNAALTLRQMNADLAIEIQDFFEDVPNLAIIQTNKVLSKLTKSKHYAGLPLNVDEGGETYTDLFTADNFHPGSLAHRIIAKKVVKAVNALYGEIVIDPILDEEIINESFEGFHHHDEL